MVVSVDMGGVGTRHDTHQPEGGCMLDEQGHY
jgi:hypothetical protein